MPVEVVQGQYDLQVVRMILELKFANTYGCSHAESLRSPNIGKLYFGILFYFVYDGFCGSEACSASECKSLVIEAHSQEPSMNHLLEDSLVGRYF